MKKNRHLMMVFFIITILASSTTSCIDFREWDKEGYVEQDINDKGLPIAIFTDEPEENKTKKVDLV